MGHLCGAPCEMREHLKETNPETASARNASLSTLICGIRSLSTDTTMLFCRGWGYEKLQSRDLETLYPAVQGILQEFSFKLDGLHAKLGDLGASLAVQTETAAMIRKGAVIKVTYERERLIKDFASRVSSVHEDIVRTIQYWNGLVSGRRDDLRIQAAAVGVRI